MANTPTPKAKLSIKEYLELHLVPKFDKESSSFPLMTHEEYMTKDGSNMLDKDYLSLLTGSTVSHPVFKTLCIDLFGTSSFNQVPNYQDTMWDSAKEVLPEVYEFGKNILVRHLLTELDELGFQISRKDLFNFVNHRPGV